MDVCPLGIIVGVFGILARACFHFIGHIPIEQRMFPLTTIQVDHSCSDRVSHDHIRKTELDDR